MILLLEINSFLHFQEEKFMSSCSRLNTLTTQLGVDSWLNKQTLEETFVDSMRQRGYQISKPAPLLTDDPTILLINSSMAPFKQDLLKGSSLPPTVIVQPCFRDRDAEDYLYSFHMLGLIADLFHAEKLVQDFMDFLLSVGFGKQSLHLVLDSEDHDLLLTCKSQFPEAAIHSVKGNEAKYKTRWQFGQSELIGRGVTVASCLRLGATDLMSSDYVPLGNVIFLTNQRTGSSYVELGFGLECIQSHFFGGKIFQIPFYKDQVDSLKNICSTPKRLLKDLLAYESLDSAGIVPSAKKAGFLCRKFQKVIYEQLSDSPCTDPFHEIERVTSVARSVLTMKQWQESLARLKRGWQQHTRTQSRNEAHAEVYVGRHREKLNPEEICCHIKTTFGLSLSKAEQLIKKVINNEVIMFPIASQHTSRLPTSGAVDTPLIRGAIRANQIMDRFLRFFVERDHFLIPGASILPQNDPTLLYVNSGMAPLKNFFLGTEKPPYPKLCNVQCCIRTNDIDDIGDRHHLSLFHMLGSWSIGDYYKEKAVQLAYDLLVNHFKFEKDKLYATVFAGDTKLGLEPDDESARAWIQEGLDPSHVVYLPAEDNFWGPAGEVGPCGPCTEVFYDTGDMFAPPYQQGKPETFDTKKRYIEIWNAGVFMQLNKQSDGSFLPLEMRSVDTGSGLERMTMTMNGHDSVYETSLLNPILEASRKFFAAASVKEAGIRMVTDHIRTAVYILSEGIVPGNTGREYIVRKLIRKCVAFALQMDRETRDFEPILSTAIQCLSDDHPHVKEKAEFIRGAFCTEVALFQGILARGNDLLQKMLPQQAGSQMLTGDMILRLVTSDGIPIEIVQLLATKQGLSVDLEGFRHAFEQHKVVSKKTLAEERKGGVTKEQLQEILVEVGPTVFVGDDTSMISTQVHLLFAQEKRVDMLTQGQKGQLIVLQTPFYAESGGQMGDRGTFTGNAGSGKITDTHKVGSWIVHTIEIEEGQLQAGELLSLQVDAEWRAGVKRNHSATHLLHAALKKVLGDTVFQKGSLVESERLRFDYSSTQLLTEEQKRIVEGQVNRWIQDQLPVFIRWMNFEEARQLGAMALFSEKYGDRVRVLEIGDASRELCGGTHVSNSREIESFQIVSDKSLAKGIRRIQALTGRDAVEYMRGGAKIAAQESQKDKMVQPDFLQELVLSDGKTVGIALFATKKISPVHWLETQKKKTLYLVISLQGNKVSVTANITDDPSKDALKLLQAILPRGAKGGGSAMLASGGFVSDKGTEWVRSVEESLRRAWFEQEKV